MTGEWVTLELTSGDCGNSLQRLMNAGILIRDVVSQGPLTVQFRVHSRDLATVHHVCGRYGLACRIVRRSGLIHRLRPLRNRPVLLLGLTLILALCLYIPEHILFVAVEGNRNIPANRILEAADRGGIRFGASRRSVENEKLKNLLLSEIDALQWAGINTYGSLAVITVREREPDQSPVCKSPVSGIVAAQDGIISSCTVTRGTGLVSPGQAVRKGQLLISGYSDFGITIAASRAEGEVFGITARSVTVKTPEFHCIRRETGNAKSRFSLRIGKKRINFYNCSGILDPGCVKMKREYVLTLPGGLPLPVVLIHERITEAVPEESTLDSGAIYDELSACARNYLGEIMIAGEITGGSERISEDGCSFRGEYICREMIGRVRDEEIGVHDETD